jgi:hypothetical protein
MWWGNVPIMGTGTGEDSPGVAVPGADECAPMIGAVVDGDSPEAAVDVAGAGRTGSRAGDSRVGPAEVLVGCSPGHVVQSEL